jgi:hypothetical protein
MTIGRTPAVSQSSSFCLTSAPNGSSANRVARPYFSEVSILTRTKVFVLRSLGCALALTAPLAALAQSNAPAKAPDDATSLAPSTASSSATTQAAVTLPDAPGYSSSDLSQSSDPGQRFSGAIPSPAATRAAPATARTRPTSPYDKYIDTHEIAPPLDAHDKMILGLRATVTPFAFLSIVSAAGFEQGRDSSPHYGTDRGAFAARVGAAGARDTSELLLSDSLLAPVFHEDPRYYQLGPRRSLFARTTYAMSRVFVTRTDDGNPTPNFSLLLGYAGAIGLSNTYYPEGDRSFKQSAENYCGSLGGAAFAFVVREFLDEALLDAHLRKRQ